MSSQASIGRTPTPWPLGPEGGLASAAGGIWQADTGPVGHALSGAGVTGGVGGGDFLTRPTADSRREPQYSAAVPATRAGGHSAGAPAVRVHADNTPGGMGSENEDPSAGQKQLVMQLLEAVAQSEQQGAKENKKESRENTPEHVEEITPTQPPLGMVNYIGAPAQPTGKKPLMPKAPHHSLTRKVRLCIQVRLSKARARARASKAQNDPAWTMGQRRGRTPAPCTPRPRRSSRGSTLSTRSTSSSR